MRDREGEWRAFGPADGSEDAGGNLLRPSFVGDGAGALVPATGDLLALLRGRADLRTEVVHEEVIDGRQATHVSLTNAAPPERVELWCLTKEKKSCFGMTDTTFAVLIEDPERTFVMEVFGPPNEAPARARELTALLEVG